MQFIFHICKLYHIFSYGVFVKWYTKNIMIIIISESNGGEETQMHITSLKFQVYKTYFLCSLYFSLSLNVIGFFCICPYIFHSARTIIARVLMPCCNNNHIDVRQVLAQAHFSVYAWAWVRFLAYTMWLLYGILSTVYIHCYCYIQNTYILVHSTRLAPLLFFSYAALER